MMSIKRDLLRLMVVTAIIFVSVACSSASEASATATPTDEVISAPTEAVSVAETPAEQANSESSTSSAMATTDRVLAWVALGTAPGQHGANNPGEIVYFSPDGTSESVLTLPTGTTRVTACGPNATSPDGSMFAFIVTVTSGGTETGTIYMVEGASNELITVASDVNPMSCVSSASFEFSPDGSRFAFISYANDAANATSPRGRLRIFNSADQSEVGNFEGVADYDLTSNGASFISFFVNDRNEATEVAIATWDGSSDREVASLRADDGCYYSSGSVATVANDELVSVLGYRCNNSNTQWQLYTIDPADRTSQLEFSADASGRYFGFSDTNAIFPSPDGTSIFFTIPDGISNRTVGFNTTSIADVAPTAYITNFGVMPSVSDLPYAPSNAAARLSPDGRFLAVVRNTADNDAVLNVIDLADPSLPPIELDAGDRGDTISDMIFTGDSLKLYYVAGADEGGNNALFALDLVTGTESRVTRGRFGDIALAPDGTMLAAMNWVVFNEAEAPYLSLVILDTVSGSETPIYVGGTVNSENKLENASFAYPLSWRRGQ